MVGPLRLEDPEPRSAAVRSPTWLDQPAGPGAFDGLTVRVLGDELSLKIWSPGACEHRPLPLLVAHDGPEYDAFSSLSRYAGAMIEGGALPPFRVALLPPGERNEWYSASARYGTALTRRILPAIGAQVPVAGCPVGMGASLGALAMLQAQRTSPGAFAGLFLQSGSFFVPRFDRHESGFPRYRRIVRFVSAVLRAPSHADPVPVAMTCGAEEENVHNNRVMCSALTAQEYAACLHEVPGLHNFIAWRDALDPYLTRLLADLWGPLRGVPGASRMTRDRPDPARPDAERAADSRMTRARPDPARPDAERAADRGPVRTGSDGPTDAERSEAP